MDSADKSLKIDFTVVIPCYQAASFLTDTLMSLRLQTYHKFEVILVDDNSNDGSFELANKLVKEFELSATVVKKPTELGRGVAGSRNHAISLASGKWIAFLDSDDLFHSRKLETINQFLLENPEIEFIHHSVIEFEEDLIPDIQIMYPDKSIVEKSILDVNYVVTSSVIIKKDVLIEFGCFDNQLNGVEDYHLWLKVITSRKCAYISSVLGFYRILPLSLMGGRKLVHYVNQNTTLLARADFLSPSDLIRVKNYLIDQLMSYYANISISNHGYFSFLQGLVLLMVRGYPACAIRLLFSKTKNHLLYKLFSN